MEPEGSLPCSQELSTGPYPEPDRSNPYYSILSLYDNKSLPQILFPFVLCRFKIQIHKLVSMMFHIFLKQTTERFWSITTLFNDAISTTDVN
jgi:hypothetical protein